ncbi:THO complex subunit 5 homolog [Littorina saxatilis]|uniref:THO complex subunit 5 homolog n=1 Tax=Littorina saxatilis TaxID=31220 RepID=UPI0038B447EC
MGEFGQYVDRVGRPYMWAQWLGGLQFLDLTESDTPSGSTSMTVCAKTSISATYMQQSIKRLRQRLKARHRLLRQLSSLEQGVVPLSGSVIKKFPAKIVSRLSSLKRITLDDLEGLPHAKRVVEGGFVSRNDLLFCAVLERGSGKGS